MNIKRGMFRLWIVISAFFVVGVALVAQSNIKDAFERAAEPDIAESLVTVMCGDTRGTMGVDYSFYKGMPGPGDPRGEVNPFATCWMPIAKYRILYPEKAGLTNNQIIADEYDKEVRAKKFNPWENVWLWLAIALAPPFVVLIVGSSLVWAFSGFAVGRNFVDR